MQTDEYRQSERESTRSDRDDDEGTGKRYFLGMLAATATGSAFVIGGMLGRANGLSAVLLAAAVPAAALLWAITLSKLDRKSSKQRASDGVRSSREFDR